MWHRLHDTYRRHGARGVVAGALRRAAGRLERPSRWRLPFRQTTGTATPTLMSPAYVRFQQMPHQVLSRYVEIAGTHVLEIGGAQACLSAHAFLDDGAARVTVTGLDHIIEGRTSADGRLSVMKADALDLRSRFEPGTFDLVFGLSVIEHIPQPERFLEEVHRVLRPGGLALFEGYPLWSSALGHHLWVTAGGGAYAGRTNNTYLFTRMDGVASTNPVPDWGHLLFGPTELATYLSDRSLPETDIACIIEWIYAANDINRLSTTAITRAYSTSPLVVREAVTQRVDVPPTTLDALRQRHGAGVDFGISGLLYVLARPD